MAKSTSTFSKILLLFNLKLNKINEQIRLEGMYPAQRLTSIISFHGKHFIRNQLGFRVEVPIVERANCAQAQQPVCQELTPTQEERRQGAQRTGSADGRWGLTSATRHLWGVCQVRDLGFNFLFRKLG